MSTPRSLACVALAIPLLACLGPASDSLQPEEPIIAPGTPPAPTPARSGPCADPCLLLLEHDFAALNAGGYCDLCRGSDPKACDVQWPGDLSCARYDWLRNCMYARIGYGFEGSDWRAVFDREPWYRPDPEFTWSRVTPVQASNAKTLQRIVDLGRCTR